ncbi:MULTISPECIES: ferritin-like domain-containing protein [unclassified Xanthobacter]|uniref:ferritin-like domain-containing protein n=1 Tax=unclassified Xanthobacter TaxID=2623496 RepID=UPI001EDF54D3|nr:MULTISPECIES: hypothetical protein [unclassified Xanthobacter]
MSNPDARLLAARRIDPNDPRPPLVQALRIGLYDEWHALAVYDAVIRRFGPVRPFANIVHSEAAHAQALQRLCARHGVPLPVNDWAGKVVLPATLAECCAAGVADEIENVAMYENFLSYPMPADAVVVFNALKTASGERHLPAFQRCLARRGVGGGRGRGQPFAAATPGRDRPASGAPSSGVPVALALAGVVALGLGALSLLAGRHRRGA